MGMGFVSSAMAGTDQNIGATFLGAESAQHRLTNLAA
jgi:hypothetical protein